MPILNVLTMSCYFVSLLHSNSQYITHACSDGSTAWEHTIECANTLKEEKLIQECILIVIGENAQVSSPLFKRVIHIKDTIQELIETLQSISKGEHTLCCMYADNMFSYAPLYKKMLGLHTKYQAQYTRSEGYPIATMPEILSPIACEIMKYSLLENTEDAFFSTSITHQSIFQIVEKRINDYDIEALLSPHDAKLLRLSLSTNVRSNFTVSKKLWDAGVRDPEDIFVTYKEKPHLFRGTPKYVYIQLTQCSSTNHIRSSVCFRRYLRK